MKRSTFKIIISIALVVGSVVILATPVVYETQVNRSQLMTTDQNNGFYAEYLFYTTYTVYEPGSGTNFPHVLSGGINITYHGDGEYSIVAVLLNPFNGSVIYTNRFLTPYGSVVSQWLLPESNFTAGHFVNLWNGSYGQITNNGAIYGTNPYSKQGIITPLEIEAFNVPMDNKTALKTPYIEYAQISGNQHINVLTLWSGYLYPFSEIFPMINFSTELVFSLSSTSALLNPLDWFGSYVEPQVIFAVPFIFLLGAFYYLTVRISDSRKRRR